MQTLSLSGKWKLYYFIEGDECIKYPEHLRTSNLKAIDAQVPGNVELDLARVGELPEDLYFGNNIHLVKPYELYEWWYEKEFDVAAEFGGKKIELIFHGVDCIATYWLNGRKIGNSNNALIEHRLDVTDSIVCGSRNTLHIQIKSAVLEAMKKDYEPSMVAFTTNFEGLWIRKAPHVYGWDIMPRTLSAGLWRSVEMIVHDENEILDVYFYTASIDGQSAKLGIYYQLKIDAKLLPNLKIRFFGKCGHSSFDVTQKLFFKAGRTFASIRDAKLWWPKGYGQPNLYEVTTQLLLEGKVIDERKDTIGIRTVELIRTETTSSDKPGEFLFKVNLVPILCKGSNWVPADAFHSRDADRYEKILELFDDLSCNMLRCWGGNVYEDHKFFDFCDRHGIMVWQDFVMACATYPVDEVFLNIMKEEAVTITRKLRNHASLVIWCGDNECDQFSNNWGFNPAYNRITREVLPQAVAKCDPHRVYIPSSPYLSPAAVAVKNSRMVPEQHLWGPRDYYKSRFYVESTSHFTGEIGYHGCPNLSSIKQFIDKQYLWPWMDNEQWITHATDSVGREGRYAHRIKLMADQIMELFGIEPDNIEDFILASQISQAEAVKFFVEMTRLDKWRRTGILWWNVMDGWPQFSDAIVDYYFGEKLAYHYIKRVQQPVCIMIDEPENWHVAVVAGNDSNMDAKGSYRIWDADTGSTLLEGNFSTRANENVQLGRIRVSHGQHRLFLMEWTINDRKHGNHYLLGHPPFSLNKYKDWLRKIAQVEYRFNADEIGIGKEE